MANKRQFNVVVEGNVGSGKSTFIEYLQKAFPSLNSISEIHEEPIKQWQNFKGFNLLKLFNDNPQRWAFQFETYVLLTMLKYQQIRIKPMNKIRITERSIYSARYCFTQALKESKIIEEADCQILSELYTHIVTSEKGLGVDLFIYLKTDPAKNLDRILKRGRVEEANTKLAYLEKLNASYEFWLGGETSKYPRAPVITVNTSGCLEETLSLFNQCATEILQKYELFSSSK